MTEKRLRPDQITTTTAILDVRARRGRKQIRGSIYYDPKELLRSGELVLPLPHDRAIAVYGDSESLVDGVIEKLHHGTPALNERPPHAPVERPLWVSSAIRIVWRPARTRGCEKR